MPPAPGYDASVFVNCPFDPQFQPLFRAIVFAVNDCGFVARTALEISNSGQVGIGKIIDLIAGCRLGIHDLSRTELDEATGLPRFNMPLELGMFLGAQWLSSEKQRRKSCLVLDRERYRYQKFCSDISGQDIEAHHDDRRRAIRAVRDWLETHVDDVIPSGGHISDRFESFLENLPLACEAFKLRPDELTFNDFTHLVVGWQRENE